MMERQHLVVIGGGLAGCEAAWQAAQAGVPCILHEMRPHSDTPAHRTDQLAELVCSNSLGSMEETSPAGLLKAELKIMGSLLLKAAEASSLPAGRALAVDRGEFSAYVEQALADHPLIEIRRQEVLSLPASGVIVLATGPLTSSTLATAIQELTGESTLYFYDAAAPLLSAQSISHGRVFRAGRHGDDDYINCPLDEEEYVKLVNELQKAKRVVRRSFEPQELFSGCMPIEEMARRGTNTLRFGPLRPIGLVDPRTGQRPYAVVQLRQDDRAARLLNMVGFQTNLTWPEQERVFRLIPGLGRAEFMRYGVMHRNTFINAPRLLHSTLECKLRPGLFIAGQLAGSEGYGAAVTLGLVAGINAARLFLNQPLLRWPTYTLTGALLSYLAETSPERFQPINPNFGLLPSLQVGKKVRRQRMSARALHSLRIFWGQLGNGRIL